MARLPSQMYVMQQMDGVVVLFEDGSERQIMRFDPADGRSAELALEEIRESGLGDEDRCFACFWTGYFRGCALPGATLPHDSFIAETPEGLVVVTVSGSEIVRFNPRDANAAAMAQKSIYDSALSEDERNRAHFWSGYFYARASEGD